MPNGMAPAPPNATSAGDPLRRDTFVDPSTLDGSQRVIDRENTPVRTRPLTRSSSHTRPTTENRQPLHNKNRFALLATDDQGADGPLADAEALIAEAQTQLNTRASVLRAYSQAIAKCAEQFSSGYGKRFAQHLRTTLLQHWSAASSSETSPTPDHAATIGGPKNPPTTAQPEKTVSFAGVARAAHETQPGNHKIATKIPPRHKRQSARNNKRILIRLRKDSTFFDKGLQIQLAIRDKLHLKLADFPDIKETNTGFALTPRTLEIQQKILQNQQLWGPLVGLEIAEKDIEWHTYLIKNFPRTITSWDGTELDYEPTIEEAIKEQTGLRPVHWRRTQTDSPATTLVIHFDQPLKSRFRLLGLGDLSFQPTRPPRLTLCDTCWLYHTPTRCRKPQACGHCGSLSHDLENCKNDTRCVGCSGPHETGSSECFALPRRTAHGSRALSKTERSHAMRQGKAAYERWELSQQKAAPAETAQVVTADTCDTEMTEQRSPTPNPLPGENNPEEGDLSDASMDIDDEEEDNADGDVAEDEESEERNSPPSTTLPPPTQPSTEQTAARQAQALRKTSTAVAKQFAVKAAIRRRVQVNPAEPVSDPIMATHSPPSSPPQPSPPKKARQTRTRSHAQK